MMVLKKIVLCIVNCNDQCAQVGFEAGPLQLVFYKCFFEMRP
jgi:hypothetical protein